MRALAPVLVLGLVVTAVPAAAQPASFQGLGDLNGGTFGSQALAASSDGNVIVGQSTSANGPEAFRWTAAGGMQGIGDLPGSSFQSRAAGVSADGSVVSGTGTRDGGTEAFRWTAAGGMVALGDLPGGDNNSTGRGLSGDGAVVIGSSSSAGLAGGDEQAFRWTQASGMVGLGDFPGGDFFSVAYATNTDGSVVVGQGIQSDNNDERAFRWTQATGLVSLGTVGTGTDEQSAAFGVSAGGDVVVGVTTTELFEFEAFRWTSATGMVSLGSPGGSNTEAYGVSADGSVVVGRILGGSGDMAFIWTSGGGIQTLRDVLVSQGVDMTGWTLMQALDVSDDGRVVIGWGINPSGQVEGWRATLAGGHRWIDPSGGSWDVASNWEPATVPGPSDNVRFDIPGTYTVFGSPAAGPRTVLGLHANDGTVDFELDNLNLISVSLTAPSLAVSSDAIAKVVSGSTTIVDAVIGFEDNPAGDTTTTARLQVFNTGTTLASSSILMVGGGTGTARGDLFVAAGELETATAVVGGGSTGTAVVGNGGEWTVANLLTVGFLARGALTIEAGGRVLTDAVTLALTDDPDAPSTIQVSGFGAGRRSELFVFDTLTVGAGGYGKLLVRNAGTVATGHLAVESIAGPRINLAFVGGLDLESGFGGEIVANTIAVEDALVVSGSGLVQANGLRVGGSGLTAVVTVHRASDDTGFLAVEGPCAVEGHGGGGASRIELFDGGEAFCRSATVFDGGSLRVDAPLSQLTVRGVIHIDNGSLRLGFGIVDAVDLNGTPTADPNDVVVLPEGEITGVGTIIGTVLSAGPLGPGIVVLDPVGPQIPLRQVATREEGTSRGTAGGALEVRGRVVLEPTATLEIPLAGPDTTRQGRLRVQPLAGFPSLDGSATLAGTLRLAFQDGYAPHTGDTFLLLDAVSATGTFAATEVTGLEPGWQFEITIANGMVVLNSLSDGIPTTPAEPGAPSPAALVLHAPAPNPTAGSTALRYELPAAGPVRLALYDMLGREVAVLVDGDRPAGAHEADLDAGALAPGVYVARLAGGTGAGGARLVTVVR